MPVDPKLESYLATLDRALNKVSVSDRADIILEIKSHVLDSLANHPEQTTTAILKALGEPEAVANRYLVERGLKPGKAPKSPMLKWLTIGFLGTLTIVVAAGIFVIFYFTPLIQVDESQGSVKILGGLISIDGEPGNDSIDIDWSSSGRSFSGSRVLNVADIDSIDIQFTNGKFDVHGTTSDTMTWTCKAMSSSTAAAPAPDVLIQGRTAALDLKAGLASKCEIGLPNGIAARFEGANGKVFLDHPQAPTEIKMSNGKVEIEPDPGRLYLYDLKVTNGDVDDFASSDDPAALKIAVSMDNGRIAKQ